MVLYFCLVWNSMEMVKPVFFCCWPAWNDLPYELHAISDLFCSKPNMKPIYLKELLMFTS